MFGSLTSAIYYENIEGFDIFIFQRKKLNL